MILAMVDANNRMRVYRFDGGSLSELAALKAATTDELELAQIGATLALMAGETNGSAPARDVVESKEERRKRLDRERHRANTAKARGMKALPAAKKTRAPKKMNPDYTPDLNTITGKIIAFLSTHEWATIPDVADTAKRPAGHVSATLCGLRDIGIVESKPGPINDKSHRPSVLYRLTEHGHASLARAMA